MKRNYKGYVIQQYLSGWFITKNGVCVAAWLPTLKSCKNRINSAVDIGYELTI